MNTDAIYRFCVTDTRFLPLVLDTRTPGCKNGGAL